MDPCSEFDWCRWSWGSVDVTGVLQAGLTAVPLTCCCCTVYGLLMMLATWQCRRGIVGGTPAMDVECSCRCAALILKYRHVHCQVHGVVARYVSAFPAVAAAALAQLIEHYYAVWEPNIVISCRRTLANRMRICSFCRQKLCGVRFASSTCIVTSQSCATMCGVV